MYREGDAVRGVRVLAWRRVGQGRGLGANPRGAGFNDMQGGGGGLGTGEDQAGCQRAGPLPPSLVRFAAQARKGRGRKAAVRGVGMLVWRCGGWRRSLLGAESRAARSNAM